MSRSTQPPLEGDDPGYIGGLTPPCALVQTRGSAIEAGATDC